MKKIVYIAALVSIFSFHFSICHAQWGDYGVKVGGGLATINDDLSTKSPIVGANIGGYINYTFYQSESVLAEVFYLQTGLNLIRRGSNFEEHFEQSNTLMARDGYYHAYYLQLPLLAGVHYELPIRQSGHVVGFYLGPAVSFGLFGRFNDRKVTPGVSNFWENYDVSLHGTHADRQVFNHLNRLDVSAVVGLSYEYKGFTVSLFVDDGFMATSESEDVIRVIESTQATGTKVDYTIPNGHNIAYMLSLSYRLGSLD